MICSHYCRCCVNIRYQRQIIVAIIVDEYDIIILLTSKCFSEVWGIPVPKEILCVLKLVYLSVTTYLSFTSCTIKIIKRDSLWPDRKEIWNDSSYFDYEL